MSIELAPGLRVVVAGALSPSRLGMTAVAPSRLAATRSAVRVAAAVASLVLLVGAVALVALSTFFALSACTPTKSASPKLREPFRDDFSREELGPKYVKRGGTWRILDGALSTSGDHNLPLWLDVALPTNVRIEFTTISRSPAVDTKIELFGDGLRHESGYSLIVGGWNNTLSVIGRLGEHEKKRVEKKTRFEANKQYRWKVERTNGRDVVLFIDDVELLRYADPEPLVGARNDRLGFSSWESDVFYDDLVITPLPD